MSTFPKTLQEAVIYYADPENCLATAIQFRWPEGVSCPHCCCQAVGFLTSRRIFKCKNKPCRKQFSCKVGTIFEDSPIGLDKWFVALWMIVSAKNGVSSWELHRAIGVTQKTAWFMLHRLRVVLQGEVKDDDPFSGTVEADESFIGGKAKNMHANQRKLKIQGRGAVGKAFFRATATPPAQQAEGCDQERKQQGSREGYSEPGPWHHSAGSARQRCRRFQAIHGRTSVV